MKKIDQLILKAFIPPFIATFFIALFVLLMQFVWKYIDDIAGKNLELLIIAKLLFYTSASLVPIALPLACLLASIMTMGALGEHFELIAFKAAGISLFRFMRAMIVTGIVISGIAFLFSNYMIPVANLKAGTLLYDIRSSRPALNIKEGVFYTGIDGYSIRIGKKDNNGTGIHDIMIYDQTSGRGAVNLITAKDGEMYMTDDKRFLVVRLLTGNHYEELPPKNEERQNEQIRTAFGEYKKYFDLSSFQLERTNESMFKDQYGMMNINQLASSADTLYLDRKQTSINLNKSLSRFYNPLYLPDSALTTIKMSGLPSTFIETQPKKLHTQIKSQALPIARDVLSYITNAVKDREYITINIAKVESEWHRKFTFSLACILLLLIGAPLGAIIRKGGLGMPLVAAVLFFVVFHVLNLGGLKLAEGLIVPVWIGIWLPLMIMSPISFYLIRIAKNDSSILSTEAYQRFFRKLFRQRASDLTKEL